MLKVENLNVFFQKAHVLRGISLEVEKGKMVGLIGRNGAGKTTLMRSIMGIVRIQSGSVKLDGTDITRAKAHMRPGLQIGYMPEDKRLIPDLSVEENILLPLWATGETDLEPRLARVYEMLPEVEAMASRRALQLSGGQQKLVALARAMIVGEKIILLDEPFEGVAPALAKRLAEILHTLNVEGISILVSASDHTYSEALTHYSYVIERGEIIEERKKKRRTP